MEQVLNRFIDLVGKKYKIPQNKLEKMVQKIILNRFIKLVRKKYKIPQRNLEKMVQKKLIEEPINLFRVASFDIGSKNFAWCIEEFDINQLEKLKKNLPKRNMWYESDGTPTEYFEPVLHELFKVGKITQLHVVDLTENNKYDLFEAHVCINMNEYLDQYMDEFTNCDMIIVEKQMEGWGRGMKAQARNTIAVKLMQNCISYFLFYYRDFKPTIEFPAFYKTLTLGAPKKIEGKKMSKYWRKKWSTGNAKEILTARGDIENLMIFQKHKKKADDIADVINQLQAFKVLVFLEDKDFRF
jgi:hypothetical protein